MEIFFFPVHCREERYCNEITLQQIYVRTHPLQVDGRDLCPKFFLIVVKAQWCINAQKSRCFCHLEITHSNHRRVLTLE